jgi:hypothetical protein
MTKLGRGPPWSPEPTLASPRLPNPLHMVPIRKRLLVRFVFRVPLGLCWSSFQYKKAALFLSDRTANLHLRDLL